MAKTKTKKGPGLLADGWRTQVGLMLYKHVGGVRLNVGITQDINGTWLVVAIESPGDTVNAVLANHAHKFLGRFGLAEAVVAAEAYAAQWKPGQEPCPCDEIPAPARRKRSKR